MDNRTNDKSRPGTAATDELQAVEKSRGEERGKGEQVSTDDLKGKKVDANPESPYEQPIRQLP